MGKEVFLVLCILLEFRQAVSAWSSEVGRSQDLSPFPRPLSPPLHQGELERKKVKSLSHVWLFATPWTVAYQAPQFVHGIFQARVLEWVAISFSRGIFLTQGWNPGLPHYFKVVVLWWLSGKESALLMRRWRFHPWVGKIPYRRKWHPTQIFLPGKSLDRGAWQAAIHGMAKELDIVT